MDSIKSGLFKAGNLIKQKSLETVEYLKSEDFKETVQSGIQKTKETAECVAQKVKENETA